MSKLSSSLKALINLPAARPNTTRAPKNISRIFQTIGEEARANNVGQSSWLAVSTAASMTMNSPESLGELYKKITGPEYQAPPTATAEVMREIGLKCISFNGIPRTINCLGAFRNSLPPSIVKSLATTSYRRPEPENIKSISDRGHTLWNSIYYPFEVKLVEKLAESHPDLPIHIINSNYGALLSDPDSRPQDVRVGRVLTSLVAVSCLRAQTGVGPQVTSHLFGLRKAVEDGSWRDDPAAGSEEGVRWMASDEGCEWILNSVDRIVEAIGESAGSTFAPVRKARL